MRHNGGCAKLSCAFARYRQDNIEACHSAQPLGIRQEREERNRLLLPRAGWDAAVSCSTQEIHHHL